MNKFQEHVGVGQAHYGLGRTGPTRDRPVTIEEGPDRGSQGGIHRDHSDGRVDAFVTPNTVTYGTDVSLTEE